MKRYGYFKLFLWIAALSCLGGCQGRTLADSQEEEPTPIAGEENHVQQDDPDGQEDVPGDDSEKPGDDLEEPVVHAWRETMGQTELKNPIASVRADTWYDYGTGDPYVMRYNGTYYLYMSTRDTHAGVKCFSSGDLVTWQYEGFCTEERLTRGAYAPEVVYYNGNFYMYTSPAGNGHYVLSSTSPTGPFELISRNLGYSIDGSVFIDHDGKWYFYHAGDNGIVAHEMSAPNKISPARLMVNAYMDGWTEGPMVVWHDGKYFLTYTGNHVFSKGYRINYGVGDSPAEFTPGLNNPVLIHTLKDPVGIGHSSTVKGPDLDSYYIVYHTLVGHAVEGMPKREMNIDRIVFHGDVMEVLGPTVTEQQPPALPFIYAYFDTEGELAEWECECENAVVTNRGLLLDKGYVLSKEQLGDQFTAEYNVLCGAASGSFGGIFAYRDENNYGRFCLNQNRQSVIVTLVEEGRKTEEEFALQGSFGEDVDLSVLQAFQVEKLGEKYVLYFNDRLAGEFVSGLSGGKIGYFSDEASASFGFIGGTNYSGGNGACTYEKPVPGTIQGIHYEKAKMQQETVKGEQNTESILLKEGDYAEYRIRVAKSKEYDMGIFYAAAGNVQYQIWMDGEPVTEKNGVLEPTGALSSYETGYLRTLALPEGNVLLRIQVQEGEMALSEFTLSESDPVENIALGYDSILDDYIYFDGKWKIKESALIMNEGVQSTGKRLYGSEGWGDYTVRADLKFLDKTMDAGIIVRASNPAMGGAGDSASAGTYFFQGYYVGLQKDRLLLAKMNYGMEVLEEVPMSVSSDQVYRLEVSAIGRKLTVSMDGDVLIEYEDSVRPFLNGAVGIRSYFSPIQVDAFTVTGEEV